MPLREQIIHMLSNQELLLTNIHDCITLNGFHIDLVPHSVAFKIPC
jgi:hypothetical protein